jgi:hypothetical protein
MKFYDIDDDGGSVLDFFSHHTFSACKPPCEFSSEILARRGMVQFQEITQDFFYSQSWAQACLVEFVGL